MKRPLKSRHFVERVFTDGERDYLAERSALRADKLSVESAAGIFCAKEAVSKALGIGLLKLPFHSIEIGHLDSGQPFVIRHPPVCQEGQVHITITHSGATAAAAAIWEV